MKDFIKIIHEINVIDEFFFFIYFLKHSVWSHFFLYI